MAPIKKPYGSWPSPISAELITRAAPSLNFIQSYGDDLYWVEGRPWEAGRNVIMRRDSNGSITDLLPAPFSHYSRVHEYGGMAYALNDDHLYFVNATDQNIYKYCLDDTSAPQVITNNSSRRFADLVVDRQNQRLIVVCEEHNDGQEPENYLASIALNSQTPAIEKFVSGADFYAYPRISPDQSQLCWIEWRHPNMPWDATQLWQATISNGYLIEKQRVAGGDNNQAIFQPHWSPNNTLYYVSDITNWWNIYRFENGIGAPVLRMNAEFATPLWQLGMTTFDFIDANTIACIWTVSGIWHSGFIDVATGVLTTVQTPYSSMQAVACHQGSVYFVAGASVLASQIGGVNLQGQVSPIYAPATVDLDKADLAQPESISFTSGDNQQVHAFYYPPTSARYCGDDRELPLVIAMCHGGPTGATSSGLNLKIQYWTNRGFAVVDINYRGSVGFGRTYRQGLEGAWGIADVEDTQHAIAYLAGQQKIDPKRCLIRGGSAGGYTVLSALTFTDTFKAGASLYGIGDLETLAKDTHKFESRYLDSLIGPYPERRDIYLERSPIHHADGLNCPVIFLQGLEDKVVPPNQAEMMVKLLEDKGIQVGYVTFADEGHGFRKANNIIRAMEAELAFYRDVFSLKGKA
jgi:dipeptidyl aminopeptidase/acylaminoacyl peptidase